MGNGEILHSQNPFLGYAMNQETLKALKGSIVKWEKIVAGKGEDRGSLDCPLCQLPDNDCDEDCPVRGCINSPWDEWSSHHMFEHDDRKTHRVFKNCPKCERLAQAELDFLKSLLPKELP